MDGSGTEQILASKWDIPFVVLGMVRVAFGNLPFWAKAIVLGLVGALAVWTAFTWLRDRGARRLSRSDRTD
ncbi:hypothetical protein ABT234_09855 [Streptomyces sp. NPDC001586]|uniref:hypothetical protein n=1 Tax=unclassified Streptomyces TaxID=2593676 RepID=UPI00331FEF31